MEFISQMITSHAGHAHWVIFFAIVLAGFNIPFSTDVIIILAAFLAATVVPENMWLLFAAVAVGCYFSAMCSYWLGRLVGRKLCHIKWLSKLFNPARLSKMKKFYEKYGIWTLVIGRFIPFGVRNCIFMSSGMSRLHFGKFILMDALACALWCSAAFYLFYSIGQNYSVLWHYVKTFNLLIFGAFSVTVIGTIWYKSRKKAQTARL
ncbi:MAG: DedA family protein [Verrucomicrobia bacterium]|nr:DedA family protein [Verrucomicrobiota bacterium]